MTRTILAYLDPGSSSMILQMLLGGVAAVGVALKLYWRRFMRPAWASGKDADGGRRPRRRREGAAKRRRRRPERRPGRTARARAGRDHPKP